MASRPLHIAFTALTLSLVVSLALWVTHASYEQIRISQAVTLQMPSVPAEINSDEVRENLRPEPSSASPFLESDEPPVMVQLDHLPKLEGIEAAPVSQNTTPRETPPSLPESEGLLGFSFDPLPANPSDDDKPLDLPELSVPSEPDDTLEFPPLEASSSKPEVAEPPLVEFVVEPLQAPRPPAWLSTQATLEADVAELKQQNRDLERAVAKREQLIEDWVEMQRLWNEQKTSWNEERKQLTDQALLAQKKIADANSRMADLRKQLEKSADETDKARQEAIVAGQQSEQLDVLLKESQAVNDELKAALKEKLSIISTLENDDRKLRFQLEELRANRRAVPSVSQTSPQTGGSPVPGAELLRNREPAQLPPLPEDSFNPDRAETILEAPVVPQLNGQPETDTEYEPPARSQPDRSRTPLIAAEAGVFEAGCAPECTACVGVEPKKKGLIYDLKDWYREWHDSSDSCTTCEPTCVRPVSAGESAAGKKGLIPDLANWRKSRAFEWD